MKRLVLVLGAAALTAAAMLATAALTAFASGKKKGLTRRQEYQNGLLKIASDGR